MLAQFSVANYLSFKEKTTLRLAAETINEFSETNVFQTPITDLNLLKSLVIYGPNSSGKSNMFKALLFMQWFILDSSKNLQASEGIEVDSFQLSTTTINQPSFFEIEFIISDVKYRYGFSVDESVVHEEWLFQVRKIKEYMLFYRKRQTIDTEEKFELAQPDLKKITRENALFLSVAAQFNNRIATEIIKKIRTFKFVSGVRDEMHIDQTARMLEDKRYTKLIKNLVLNAGLGFIDVKAERVVFNEQMLSKVGMPKELRSLVLKEKKEKFHVSTTHQVYDENNNPTEETFLSLLENESLGTQKFFSLAGPIIDCLLTGGLLIVDEFSSRMSSILCEAIIKLFNSKTNNPYNAQFLFVTHNTQFINKNSNIFRRDQMILFKKGSFGATEVHSLYDLRVRKDASFDKEYFSEIHESLPSIDISKQLSIFDTTVDLEKSSGD